MHKTPLYITAIIASAFVLVAYWYIGYLKSIGFVKMDRFTVCVQTVMTESRQSNKPIDAEKAKDICVNIKYDKRFK